MRVEFASYITRRFRKHSQSSSQLSELVGYSQISQISQIFKCACSLVLSIGIIKVLCERCLLLLGAWLGGVGRQLYNVVSENVYVWLAHMFQAVSVRRHTFGCVWCASGCVRVPVGV